MYLLGGHTASQQQLQIAKKAATASRTNTETTGNSPVDRELGTAGRWRDAPVRVGRGQVQPAAAPLEASAAASHVLIYLKILSALQKSQSFGTVGERKFFVLFYLPP